MLPLYTAEKPNAPVSQGVTSRRGATSRAGGEGSVPHVVGLEVAHVGATRSTACTGRFGGFATRLAPATQHPRAPADTPDMTLETALWIGALAAAAQRHRAHLDGDLAELVEQLLRKRRPRARA